jgi:hypothetical protein
MWGQIGVLAGLAGFGALAAANNVSDAVPAKQSAAALSLMRGAQPRPGFENQVAFITAVQDRVLKASPGRYGIPLGHPRELTDVLEARHGFCFDRSRAIETVLRTYGFKTRHIFVLSTAETASAVKSLVSPRVKSHVLTEVRTDRGWLLVDPDRRWIGLTADGKLATLDNLSGQKWRSKYEPMLGRPFIYLRGVYSRHGRFYPPYNAIPDVSWPEIVGA